MTVTKNEDALLSIGGLSRASGVSVETLRNWERRYGFPIPVRRSSGHRRYTWDVVARLRLIRRAIDLGYKPSFAVVASEEELRDAFDEISDRHLAEPLPASPGPGNEIDAWLSSVERFDTAGLELGLRRAWSRHGAYDFVLRLVIPFLREIGDRWENGQLQVAHEHFASELLATFLGRQWRPLSHRARGPRVVLASLEGEQHNLGLHMAAIFLALSDMEVVLLGPNTPRRDIELAGSQPRVEAVVIGLSAAADPARCAREIEALRDSLKGSVVVAFGGNEEIGDLEGIIYFATLDAFADWAHARALRATSRPG